MFGFVRRGCQRPVYPGWQAARRSKNLSVHHSYTADFVLNSDRAGVSRTQDFKSGWHVAEMESVLSICPIASAKQANRFTLDPQWTGIRTVATYRFWMGHALLLVKTRFLRPRNSRSESAMWPGKWPRRCPQPRAVRVRSGAVSSPQPGRVRVQSVTASASASCPWAVHVRDRDRAANVRVLAVGRP